MIISRTPLRISFFGGGTDFREWYRAHGGAVLSAAIDKYVYVCINPRFGDDVRVSYSRTEIVESARDLQHDIVREALDIFSIERGIEIVTIADVPGGGTGLGSSSALAVGLVAALAQYTRGTARLWRSGPKRTAQRACQIEIERLQKPIGEQDQYIAAFGGFRLMEWQRNGEVMHSELEIQAVELQPYLMLFYTGATRPAEKILAEQQGHLEKHQVVLDALGSAARQGYSFALQRNWEAFGRLLDTCWQLKKQLADDISNERIDALYDAALKAGAWGGKICGAGGGGFLLIMAAPERQAAVRQALRLRELVFKFESGGCKVIRC